MASKPICLVVYGNPAKRDLPEHTTSGLYRALELLSNKYQFVYKNAFFDTLADEQRNALDCVLMSGTLGAKVDQWVWRHVPAHIPKAAQITSSYGLRKNVRLFVYDLFFYETHWYFENVFKMRGRGVHAFGTVRSLFYPPPKEAERDIDYLLSSNLKYPGGRRPKFFLKKNGKRVAILGTSKKAQEITKVFQDAGIEVIQPLGAEDLANLYRRTKVVYIPHTVTGGGDRTLLEARACGCKVEIEKDNPKLRELLNGPIYDEQYYARQIDKGLQLILRQKRW